MSTLLLLAMLAVAKPEPVVALKWEHPAPAGLVFRVYHQDVPVPKPYVVYVLKQPQCVVPTVTVGWLTNGWKLDAEVSVMSWSFPASAVPVGTERAFIVTAYNPATKRESQPATIK